MTTPTEIQELARTFCATVAEMHAPRAEPAAVAAANRRLVALVGDARAPRACALVLRHARDLVRAGAPVAACAFAAGVVEKACRRREIGGDEALAL